MNEAIRNIEPKEVWNHFTDLNAVPRPSKKEERVIAFMKAFGESLQLPTYVDEVGNVIIKKPATAGMENRKVVCTGNPDRPYTIANGIKKIWPNATFLSLSNVLRYSLLFSIMRYRNFYSCILSRYNY